MSDSVDMDGAMMKEATQPYIHCETHLSEMMEKNIACLTCSRLVCALCMRDSHLSHDIISVIKLRECMSLREKVADDLNELQVLQKRLQTQMEERQKALKEVEVSSKNLCTQLENAFDQLQSIIEGKKEEVKKYVNTFKDKNLEHLKCDLKEIEEKYTNSTRMIQKVITCTTRPHRNMNDLMELPQQLKTMLKQSQLLSRMESVDVMLAENKFAKVLPSLQAVSNICQTLHPEATKVVWSKVTPDKKDKDNGTMPIGLKRKSNPALKALKRMKRSPPPTADGEKNKQSTENDSNPQESCHQEQNHCPSSPKTASDEPANHPGSTTPHPANLPSPEKGEKNTRLPDSSTGSAHSPEGSTYRLINLDMLTVSQGNFVMGQNSADLNIGKVVEVTRLHSLHFVSVQWYHGAVGKSKLFTVSEKWIKKADLVNSEGLICSFTFDPLQPIEKDLERELMRAGQEFIINGSASSPFAKRVRTKNSPNKAQQS